MTLEEILNDAQNFTDDIELTVKDQKVTLGGLRNLTKAQQKKLSEQMDAANKDRQSAADLATKSATLFAELTKKQEELAAAATTTRTQPTDADDFDSADYWNPVRKRLSPIEKQLKETQDALKNVTAQLTNAATIWAKERWANQFESVKDRLKKSEQYKDWDVDKLVGYATEKKKLDSYGFPSVIEAVADLTRANELDEIRRAARDEGLREGLTRGRLGTTRPTSAAGGVNRAAQTIDPNNNLNDLADVTLQDPEIAQMLSEIGAL
jgi:hypothetical protein